MLRSLINNYRNTRNVPGSTAADFEHLCALTAICVSAIVVISFFGFVLMLLGHCAGGACYP